MYSYKNQSKLNTMKIIKKALFVSAITAGMIACKTDKPAEKTAGIVLENMDTSVKPADDFFRHVNGAWLDKTEIPADRTSWGGFGELRKKTDADVLEILNTAIQERNFPKVKDAEGNEIDSDQEKAVNYYETIMDTVARNKQGIEPIKPFLAKIDEIKSKKDVETYITNMAPYGGGGFYGFGVYNDLKNSSQYAGYMGGGSLGLSRDYYVDAKVADKLVKYQEFVAKSLMAFGDDEATAKKNAATIVAFEKSLAEPMMTKEERRDTRKMYNPMTVAELSELVPVIDWNAHLKGIGVDNIDKVIVTDPGYFKAMSKVLKSSPIEDVKLFLRWNAINTSLGLLSTDLEKANWEFYSKEMRGAKQQRPRDERALGNLNGAIGEALGKLYVDAKFPPEAKQKAREMIDNVMIGFENRIAQLPWMSEETKKKALEKLHKLTVKIAYPDKWKDYSSLVINKTDYFGNLERSAKVIHEQKLKKQKGPVKKHEWDMTPQTVNAYYYPPLNEIVFPAAILQPPFFDLNTEDAVNYGAIGSIIGHEIGHGFDATGSAFDGDGALRNWWSDKDKKEFRKRAAQLIKQYDSFAPFDDLHVNGEFTLDENIGDLSGISIALQAYKLSLKGKLAPVIEGFTGEQRVFIGYAQVWRNKYREKALRHKINTDEHSPSMYRINGAVRNVTEFYTAFDVKEKDKLYLAPEQRVKMW